MTTLRILVAARVPDDRRGGMTRLMAFAGDQIEAAGHRVEYFYAPQALRYGARGRLARFSFPLAVFRHVRAAWRAGGPYDIVNVHEPQGAALLLLRRWAGSPRVVVTSHGSELRAWKLGLEEARLGRGGPSLSTRVVYPATSLWQSGMSLRRADHIFCLSEEDRTFIASRYRRHPAEITRIFPAADAAYAQAAARRDYAQARRVLFAATWRKNKGIQDLVPAFAALARAEPEVTMTVLGAGVPDETVAAAFPAELRACVRCRRTETERETIAEFAAHDLFVLPSLFEGTPLTLIEAMASGLPIVTTATCGMRDVVRDGVTGLLVPTRSPDAVTQALLRLIRDRTLRERLGSTAQSEARQRYTWPAVAQPVLRLYEELARAEGRPRAR